MDNFRINSLKGPVPDLIGLGIHPKDDNTKDRAEGEDARLLPAAIPTSDRPMSFVQEECESPTEKDLPPPPLPEKAPRTAAAVAVADETKSTTTVLKVPKPSSSNRSISEDEIRKEFPDLPRKK